MRNVDFEAAQTPICHLFRSAFAREARPLTRFLPQAVDGEVIKQGFV